MQQDNANEPFNPTYWGVPDWRVGGSKMISWAWEFLRRDWGYRQFWRQEVLPFIDPATGRLRANIHEVARHKQVFEHWNERHPGLQATFWELELFPDAETEERFGVLSIADPRDSSAVPRFKLPGQRFYGGPVPIAMNKVFGDSLHGSRVDLAEHEVAIVFDLHWPADGQLERAARTLQTCAREWGYSPLSRRGRPDKYEEYLRVLDADDCGAMMSRLPACYFPDSLTGCRLFGTNAAKPASFAMAAIKRLLFKSLHSGDAQAAYTPVVK